MGVIANLFVKLGLKNESFNKGLDQSQKKSKSFGNSMKKVGGMIAGAFAFGAVISGIKKAVSAADKQLQAENTLLVALKGRKDVQQSLIKQAQQLQKETLFGDEETIQAQSLVAAFVKEEEQIKQLTPVIQDLATAKGMSLAGAADLVTKTFASSTNAMSRYGIEVVGAAGSAERLESITNALTGAFGGQAKAAAQVGLGPIKQLSNSWGDAVEILGKVFLPIIVKIAQKLSIVTDYISNNEEKVKRWSLVLLSVIGVITGVGVAFKLLTLIMAANPFILIATAITAVGVGLTTLWKNSEIFRAKFKYATESTSVAFQKMWLGIKEGAELMWLGIKTYFTAIPKAAKAMWNIVKRAMKGENIGDAIKDEFGKIITSVSDAGDAIKSKYKEKFAEIESPDYKKILANESAKIEAEKAGEQIGISLNKGITKGSRRGQLLGKLKGKGSNNLSSNIPSMDLEIIDKDAYAEAQAATDAFHAKQLASWMDFKDQMAQTMEAFAEDVVVTFAAGIGEMLAAGNTDPADLGQKIMSSMGSFLSQLGGMMVSFGIASKWFQSLLVNIANPAAAIGLVAAGAVLVALGSAISTKAASKGNGSSSSGIDVSSGSYSRANINGISTQTNEMKLSAIITGDNLYLSNERNTFKKGSIG